LITAMALLLSTAALAAPVDAADNANHSAPAQSTAGSTLPHHTRIVLHLRHSGPGTQVELVQGATGWHSRNKTVRHGQVSFRVRTWRTMGMSFAVTPRWLEGAGIWQPYAVVRYAQTRTGRLITTAVAAKKKRASGCWAGTLRRRVDMVVRVRPFIAPDAVGEPGTWARVWMRRMRHNWPPSIKTFHGSIGSQDFLVCEFP
jgi:hypothetical protein